MVRNLLITCFSLLSIFCQAQDGKRIFERGYYYLPFDREKAIELFTQAIRYDSSFASAFYHRGLAKFKSGNYQGAVKDFSHAFNLDSTLRKAQLHRGFAYRQLGFKKEALNDFRSYGNKMKGDSSAFNYVLRGKASMDLADYRQAYEDFSEALALDPGNESILYYRFFAAMEGHLFNNALNDINRLIILNPDFYGYYFQKGNLFFNRGLYEEAEVFYNKSLLENPYNADGFFQRGLTHEGRGNFIKAISDYSKAILLNPDDGVYYSRRGNAKLAVRDKDGACADWMIANELGYFKDFRKIEDICR